MCFRFGHRTPLLYLLTGKGEALHAESSGKTGIGGIVTEKYFEGQNREKEKIVCRKRNTETINGRYNPSGLAGSPPLPKGEVL
jgi:hypothetical protein